MPPKSAPQVYEGFQSSRDSDIEHSVAHGTCACRSSTARRHLKLSLMGYFEMQVPELTGTVQLCELQSYLNNLLTVYVGSAGCDGR